MAAGATTSALACDHPPPLVSIPEGADATTEELLTAPAGVREYMARMETYLACIDDELTTAGDDASAHYRSIMESRYEAAVAEMEAVAAEFNEQIQAYREANPDAG